MTLKKRLVMRSATRTAKCCRCGHFRLMRSQYSIVLTIWSGSVSPSIVSTSYIESSRGFLRRMSRRPAGADITLLCHSFKFAKAEAGWIFPDLIL